MENKKEPLRILLADDHRVLRKGLSLLLSSEEDFSVVAEASDGEEALEKAAKTPVDIALLDLSMPRMGGLECLRRLKAMQPAVRVLILTMHSEREAELLIDGALEEPEEPAALSAREREVLELIVHGYSLSTIADKLYLSIKTVSTYKTRLLQKLDCTQNSELVDYALRHNILGKK